MARLNVKVKPDPLVTHEGGPAIRQGVEAQLRRSCLACLLWEGTFYEDGMSIADRIASLVPQVEAQKVAALAIEARTQQNLRHLPLLLVHEMSKHPMHRPLVASTVEAVVQRPDEITELLAMCLRPGKTDPKKMRLANVGSIKHGLARAFQKFDSYQIAKYRGEGRAVTLRDALFFCHPKPKDEGQAAVWKSLAEKTLEAPDTWEVALSGGDDKKETFERLMSEGRLGAMALLRNLRKMREVGVDEEIIRRAINRAKFSKVLPFRFLAAARYAPYLEPVLEQAMLRSVKDVPRLPGQTVLLVDTSGSMIVKLSEKSEMLRIDAAAGLAVLAREICDDPRVIAFSTRPKEMPPRQGFALRDALAAYEHGGTSLGEAVRYGWSLYPQAARMIVITDEQSHDRVDAPPMRAYMINVAAYQNGVGYGPWIRLDGWSEAVLTYIREYEAMEAGRDYPRPDEDGAL